MHYERKLNVLPVYCVDLRGNDSPPEMIHRNEGLVDGKAPTSLFTLFIRADFVHLLQKSIEKKNTYFGYEVEFDVLVKILVFLFSVLLLGRILEGTVEASFTRQE